MAKSKKKQKVIRELIALGFTHCHFKIADKEEVINQDKHFLVCCGALKETLKLLAFWTLVLTLEKIQNFEQCSHCCWMYYYYFLLVVKSVNFYLNYLHFPPSPCQGYYYLASVPLYSRSLHPLHQILIHFLIIMIMFSLFPLSPKGLYQGAFPFWLSI